MDYCASETLNDCTIKCYRNGYSPCRTCHNVARGGFQCTCPQNYYGDGRRRPGSGCTYNDGKEGGSNVGLILGLSIGIVVVLVVLCLCLRCRRRKNHERRKQTSNPETKGNPLTNIGEDIKLYSYVELMEATDSFSDNHILGSGGQATVYKGNLGGCPVAIKRCNLNSEKNQKDFENEIRLLGKINHPNVVEVLGYSLKSGVNPPCIVYELVEHGTLSDLLHKEPTMPLVWSTRLDIAIGVADAIKYLHFGIMDQIILHRDIKSLNILLDHNQQPKLGDFGISRTIEDENTHVKTRAMGTDGYAAPETKNNQYSPRQDVFSYGVLLCEMVARRKALFWDDSSEQKISVSDHLLEAERERLPLLLDKEISHGQNQEQMLKVVEIARSCCHADQDQRPTMRQVTEELKAIRDGEPKEEDAVSVGSSSRYSTATDEVAIIGHRGN